MPLLLHENEEVREALANSWCLYRSPLTLNRTFTFPSLWTWLDSLQTAEVLCCGKEMILV